MAIGGKFLEKEPNLSANRASEQALVNDDLPYETVPPQEKALATIHPIGGHISPAVQLETEYQPPTHKSALLLLEARDEGIRIQRYIEQYESLIPPSIKKLNKIIADGKAARREFDSTYLPLVLTITERYVSEEHSLQELMQAGSRALEEAVVKFNPAAGIPFIEHVKSHIDTSMHEAILPKRAIGAKILLSMFRPDY